MKFNVRVTECRPETEAERAAMDRKEGEAFNVVTAQAASGADRGGDGKAKYSVVTARTFPVGARLRRDVRHGLVER